MLGFLNFPTWPVLVSSLMINDVKPCFVQSPKDEVLKGFVDSRSDLLSLRRMEEKNNWRNFGTRTPSIHVITCDPFFSSKQTLEEIK